MAVLQQQQMVEVVEEVRLLMTIEFAHGRARSFWTTRRMRLWTGSAMGRASLAGNVTAVVATQLKEWVG